jgi:exodeoxyribonuclease V
MSFQLTTQQSQALDMVKKMLAMPKGRPLIARIRGYAGTGKTTMLRVLGAEIGDMAIVTPTGKSAINVTERTGLEAMTAHRWMYTPREDPLTGRVTFQRQTHDKMQRPSSGLIVIDEASMVNLALWEDIYLTARDLGCHILCVGDPFQLPPVEDQKREEPFGLLEDNFKFDFNTDLTEVHRQALDSPIIRASMMIREGKVEQAVMLLPRIKEQDFLDEHVRVLESGGVVICHKNSSRHELNDRIRRRKNLPKNGIAGGEPLLVLRNNYELNRFNGEVLNFTEWKRPPGKQWEIYDRWKDRVEHSSFGLATLESGEEAGLAISAVTGRLGNDWISSCDTVSKTAVGEKIPYLHCNFGYTLTAHKSQGSEWKRVIVAVEPSTRVGTRDGRRWFYTGVTRASEWVSIVWNVKIT